MPPKSKQVNGKPTDVPKLDDDGADYDNWKIKVRKWCKVSKIKKSQQATYLQLALGIKGFQATKHIPDEDLETKTGVKLLIDALDEFYIPDKLQHRIILWRTFYNTRRQQNGPMMEHIHKFMDAFQEFKVLSEDILLDDSILAHLLLESCNLGDEDRKIVTAQMEEPPSSKNLKSILKRVFSTPNNEDTNNQDKANDSDVFLARSPENKTDLANKDNTHPTLYTKDNRRVYRPERRGRHERRPEPWSTHHEGPRKNSMGLDGRVRKCHVCDSIWHFFKDCPEKEKIRKKDDYSHEVSFSF